MAEQRDEPAAEHPDAIAAILRDPLHANYPNAVARRTALEYSLRHLVALLRDANVQPIPPDPHTMLPPPDRVRREADAHLAAQIRTLRFRDVDTTAVQTPPVPRGIAPPNRVSGSHP